jgi:hypothetical protein
MNNKRIETKMNNKRIEHDMTNALPEMNPVLGTDVPLLQWSSGKTQMRSTPGKGYFAGVIGFHSEMGRYPEFDEACAAAGIGQVEIRHQSGETKIHWGFGETLTVCPVTTGPVITSVFRLGDKDYARRTAQAGLGVRWTKDQQDRPRSQVAVRCFLPALVAHDYWGSVQLMASSTMSDRLLAALADHVRVCHAADKELGKRIFAAELHLPLGPGAEVTVGKAQQMTLVPFVAQHPKTLTRAYVDEMYHPDGVTAAVEQLWEAVVSWATEYTTALPVEERTARPGSADDLYLPRPEDIEACIKQARTQELLETYRQHLLALRERREIDSSEQMRLAQLIEERLGDIVGLV